MDRVIEERRMKFQHIIPRLFLPHSIVDVFVPQKYEPEDVACIYCTKYRVNFGCTVKTCPWARERYEAGVVDFTDLLREILRNVNDNRFNRRAVRLSKNKHYISMTPDHYVRFKEWRHILQAEQGIELDYRGIAALYLLAGTNILWIQLNDAITTVFGDADGFDHIPLRGIGLQDYVLYKTAKAIYTTKEHISTSELASRSVTGDDAFRKIVDAIMIASYGQWILELSKAEVINANHNK